MNVSKTAESGYQIWRFLGKLCININISVRNHNPRVGGSSPSSATIFFNLQAR
jgi:hypothetical protein